MRLYDTTVSSGPRRVSDAPVMPAFSGCAADLHLRQLFLRPSGSCLLHTFLTAPGHVSGSRDSSLVRNAPVMLSAPVSRSTNSKCG